MLRVAILLLICVLFSSSAFGQLKPDEIREYKNVDDITLNLHMFKPADWSKDDTRPAVVFFFGGGWNSGRINQFFVQSKYLAERGMVSFCAEYRVKSRNNTTPAECVKDGKSAIRWIRSHADELGVDSKKILAGGGSAGGHVAAATATTQGFDEAGEDTSVSCKPAALLLFNPVFDNGPKGYGHDRVKEYWKDFSPIDNISSDTPPTIVFLGTADKLIPVATGERFKKLMEEAGGKCELHLFKKAEHGFFNRSKFQAKTLLKADKFLEGLGFLTGPPNEGLVNSIIKKARPPKKKKN